MLLDPPVQDASLGPIRVVAGPSAEELARFVDFSPAALAMFDTQMRYLVVNQRWRSDFGLADQPLAGRSHYELFPDIPARWKQVHERCLAGAVEKCDEDRYVREDGTVYWLRWEVHPWRDASGAVGGLLFFSEDITVRKELELALLESTNREQQRLGYDLHDGLGQELTAISLLASTIAQSERRRGGPNAEALDSLVKLALHAISTCRATAHGLAPLEYSSNDLVAALKEMLDLQLGTFGITTGFSVVRSAEIRLDGVAQENMYRIAQEAVSSARRHAQARSIDVTLDIKPASVRLEVLDDGIGLMAPGPSQSGIGLKVMGVRAGLIGARLSIEPGPRGGTSVAVDCPQPG